MFKTFVALSLGTMLIGACATADQTRSDVIARGDLKAADGSAVGRAELIRTGDAVLVRLAGKLEPGEKAFHLHQAGRCDAPDFSSAGGHLNPFGRQHGKLNELGRHLGDLPNLVIPETGAFETTAKIEGSAGEVLPTIFDADGTAVVVHAGPDDYMSDPAGNAGKRIACAMLKRVD